MAGSILCETRRTKVVWHGWYVTFQLAEMAIPRRLFAEIPQQIDGLRSKPAPT